MSFLARSVPPERELTDEELQVVELEAYVAQLRKEKDSKPAGSWERVPLQVEIERVQAQITCLRGRQAAQESS